MGNTPKALKLQLHFSEDKRPELWKVVFTDDVGSSIICTRKKYKTDTAPNKFGWKSGTQGFVLALLDYKLNCQKNKGLYEYAGSITQSPAASACNAIEKQGWILGGFGGHSQMPDQDMAKQVFSVRKNNSTKRIALLVDSELLPPENIQIFSGFSAKALSAQGIKKLSETVQWTPHRTLESGNDSTDTTLSILTAQTHPSRDSVSDTVVINTVPVPQIENAKSKIQTLTVAGDAEFQTWEWSYERLLKEFIALDYDTAPDLRLHSLHEGTPEQWADVFKDNPQTWRMLISAPGQICGYWHIAPMFEKEYLLVKDGKLLDSKITTDIVCPLFMPGEYDIYFVQICMHERYRDEKYVRQLVESILDVFEDLAREGIFIREITANAFTKRGHALCRLFGMKELCDHYSGAGKIYSAPINSVLKSHLGRWKPKLKAIYENARIIPVDPIRENPSIAAANTILEALERESFEVEVRHDASVEEVKSVWELDQQSYGTSCWPLADLTNRWKAFPRGSQSAFIYEIIDGRQKAVSVASFGLWPIIEKFAYDLQECKAMEDDLTPKIIRDALKSPIKYWYFSGIEVRPDLRRRNITLLKLLTIGLRDVWKSERIEYPCFIYAYGFSEAGIALLERFGFSCIEENTPKGGWPLYRATLKSDSDFEEFLRRRGL